MTIKGDFLLVLGATIATARRSLVRTMINSLHSLYFTYALGQSSMNDAQCVIYREHTVQTQSLDCILVFYAPKVHKMSLKMTTTTSAALYVCRRVTSCRTMGYLSSTSLLWPWALSENHENVSKSWPGWSIIWPHVTSEKNHRGNST